MAIPNFMNLNIGGHIRIIWDFQLKGPWSSSTAKRKLPEANIPNFD
jgi:hypothetical protein